MDFQNAIGRERIEQRVRTLHARLRERVAALPNVKILTSGHAGLSCALLGFSWDHLNNKALVDTLLARHGIYIRTIDYGLNAVRVSTHYYNTEEQVDRLGDALQEVLKNGVMSPALAGQAASRYAGDEYEG